ncbi:MAG: hypothetical protein ACI88A_004742 [Paraglaciecola sp.]
MALYFRPGLSQALSIAATALRRWISQLSGERNGVTPKSHAMTADQQKIPELEARIKQITWENDTTYHLNNGCQLFVLNDTKLPVRSIDNTPLHLTQGELVTISVIG